MSEVILVTGGAGFIGSNFVRMLVSECPEIRVVNLDALTYAGNLENLAEIQDAPNYEFVHGDIRDREFLKDLFRRYHFTGVINFAAESHVDRSIENPGLFIETNVQGTLNLLQAARETECRRYLQVSTDEVYGSLGPEDPPFTENNQITPNSPYAASKAAADHLVHAFGHTYGMDVVITRCSNNYGMYQFPEKMIPLMFNNARQDKPLPVYGDGMQIRDWLFVLDHCRAVWSVFQHGRKGEVYNIGGCNEKTNLEVVKLILDFLGKPHSLIEHVTDRPGHDRRYAIDAGKIMSELGWKPSVTFEEGIAITLQWYLDHEDWMSRVTSGQYQQYYERMYRGR
ncbi:MAG: dTDP-glucose 4,6-dehydratase [Lentisphaerae bacterium]|nr:MAG: dTDP-glucose 4,6-dehydratase [Lentisphaerota bacterium]